MAGSVCGVAVADLPAVCGVAGCGTVAERRDDVRGQNRQSQLLAVASMAVLSIYLRQRGSPESKPVGAAHGSTGVEG